MDRWEQKISINAPADKVFAYVSDFSRHPEWAEHGLQILQGSEGPSTVGSKYATQAKLYGTQKEHSTVTELTPGTQFGWESVGSLGKVHHWFMVADDGGAATLTKGAEFVQAKFLAKIMMGRIRRDLPGQLDKDLAKIKSAVEGSAV